MRHVRNLRDGALLGAIIGTLLAGVYLAGWLIVDLALDHVSGGEFVAIAASASAALFGVAAMLGDNQ